MTAPAWRRRHQLVMLPITLVSLLLFEVAQPTNGAQLTLLVLAVAVVGIPHGALDDLVAASFLPKSMRPFPVFATLYVGVAAAVVLAWVLDPVASLAVFLILSLVHFGLGDAPEVPRPLGRSIAVVARGGVPILVPMLFHPAPVADVFSFLVATPLAAGDVHAVASLAVVPFALAFCLELARLVLDSNLGRARVVEVAELAAISLLFIVAPPLLSFAIYFGGWHSLRHLLDLGSRREGEGGTSLRAVVRDAWPITSATLVVGVVVFASLVASGRGAESAVLTSVFVGLSALTVPHMLLTLAAGSSALPDPEATRRIRPAVLTLLYKEP